MTTVSTKEYTTRDGRDVKIWTTEARSKDFPVLGEVKNPRSGSWEPRSWDSEGQYWTGEVHGLDLVGFLKPRIQRTVWVNIYHEGSISSNTLEEADRRADSTRIACIPFHVDCMPGEGIDD